MMAVSYALYKGEWHIIRGSQFIEVFVGYWVKKAQKYLKKVKKIFQKCSNLGDIFLLKRQKILINQECTAVKSIFIKFYLN